MADPAAIEYPKTPDGLVRRWKAELTLADKREEDWRKKVKEIWERYRAEKVKKNSFNILYSNTETLAAAVYNSPPMPDVRRRFRDHDPIGKVVSQVLERSLEFSIDTDQFANTLTADVLDMLIPGRGVGRVKYLPKFVPSSESAEEQDEADGESASGEPSPPDADNTAVESEIAGEGQPLGDEDTDSPEEMEELAWEQVVIEHVQWDKFRHGPGKKWEEVEWISFEHSMKKEELDKKFGDNAKNITLDDVDLDDIKAAGDDVVRTFKTATVYEIWDKVERKVLFISKQKEDEPLLVSDDKLKLTGFYPIPRPLMALMDSDSLLPIPLYVQYEEQARELDLVSSRINKIVDACKLRGIYDSTMSELSELMKGNDNDLIPAQDAARWIAAGGIEKSIWMMPIDGAAKVLQVLHEQRESSKQVIYEITGIADIMRGATDPGETLGAQQLKARWGGQRVNRLQREVERYVRDQLRLMAEVIAQEFDGETLVKMTGMKIPTQKQVDATYQRLQQQGQQQAMMAQQQGQPPQPPPPMPPPPDATLEQVMEVLRDDCQRTYKVSVETDSMTAGAQQQDMQELQQLLAGIAATLKEFGPAVMSGMLPADGAKEIMMAVVRRARLGTAVEDSLDKMTAPKPPPDPNKAKADAEMQMHQMTLQADQARAQQEGQTKAQIAQIEAQASAQADQVREQARAQADREVEGVRASAQIEIERNKLAAQFQLDEAERNHKAQLAAMTAQQGALADEQKYNFERWKVEYQAGVQIQLAEIAAKATEDAAQRAAAKEGAKE